MLVAPFIRPSNGVGDTPPLPYYMYAVAGWALMAFAVFYWAMWKKILPWVFRYKLVPVKETLSDGTVLTVVRLPCPHASKAFAHSPSFAVRTQETGLTAILVYSVVRYHNHVHTPKIIARACINSHLWTSRRSQHRRFANCIGVIMRRAEMTGNLSARRATTLPGPKPRRSTRV